MADETSPVSPNSLEDFFSRRGFPRIFQTFLASLQPGRLLLALAAIICLAVAGFVLDALTFVSSSRVIATGYIDSADSAKSELDVYARSGAEEMGRFKEDVISASEGHLKSITTQLDLELDKLAEAYRDHLSQTRDILNDRYQKRQNQLLTSYQEALETFAVHKDKRRELGIEYDINKEKLANACETLFKATFARPVPPKTDVNAAKSRMMVPGDGNPKNEEESIRDSEKTIDDTILLNEAEALTRTIERQGIFATLVSFYSDKFNTAVVGIFQLNSPLVCEQLREALMGLCWLARYHYFYAILLLACWLAIWAIAGGAICRMAALRFARDERIGPMAALRFSLSKFVGFFSAPLIPVVIVAALGIIILLGGLIGAIPGVGEIIVGLLMGLALIVGAIMAFITLGLLGGCNLMYPAIAVEGSDGLDAISRSFSYVFKKPWRMGFYTVLACVYGAICYLFVRCFVFVMFLLVRIFAKLCMNWDSSSYIEMRGKLDAIWPAPSLGNLHPELNFSAMGPMESIGAILICVWVFLVVGLVISFVASYFFTANTTIYFLMRRKVDDTDYNDVYLDEDLEDLITDTQPENSSEIKQPTEEPQPQDDNPTYKQDDEPETGNESDQNDRPV